MIFYDTCSLLNGYTEIFKNIKDEPFVISNITLGEVENIKSSKVKDNEIKYKANKLSKTSDTCTYYNNAENCSITSATITPPANASVI